MISDHGEHGAPQQKPPQAHNSRQKPSQVAYQRNGVQTPATHRCATVLTDGARGIAVTGARTSIFVEAVIVRALVFRFVRPRLTRLFAYATISYGVARRAFTAC